MAAFNSDEITKIYSFGGAFDPVTGLATWKDGSAITSPSELKDIGYGAGTAAPTTMNADQLMANYTPEQIGAMDLSNSKAGQFAGADNSNGLGDFTSQDFGNYASGVGAIGQLGLGALSYLENKKTADAQRNLLNQQYTTNNEMMGNYRKDRQHAIDTFKAK